MSLIFQDVIYFFFINNLWTDLHSSHGIKPHVMMFTMLDFLWKKYLHQWCYQQYHEGNQLRYKLSHSELQYFVWIMVAVNWWLTIADSQHDNLQCPDSLYLATHFKYFFYIVWYCASPAMRESPNGSILGVFVCVLEAF